MDDTGFFPAQLADQHIVIWGLGLMGGSLAKGLKDKCAALGAIDVSPEVLSLALEQKIIDHGSTQPEMALRDADIIVLATPVRTIIKSLGDLGSLSVGSPVVLDLGSTKRAILEKMNSLPAHFDPIGGHPICGKEKGTLLNADKSIFDGAPFALVSLPRTTNRAKTLVENIVRSVRSFPYWIDADAHDTWVAATSHVPYLIANALALSTPLEALSLIGSGFRSATRLANSSPQMMIDILATNDDNIKKGIEIFKDTIGHLEQLLEQKDWNILAHEFEKGAEKYQSFVARRERDQ